MPKPNYSGPRKNHPSLKASEYLSPLWSYFQCRLEVFWVHRNTRGSGLFLVLLSHDIIQALRAVEHEESSTHTGHKMNVLVFVLTRSHAKEPSDFWTDWSKQTFKTPLHFQKGKYYHSCMNSRYHTITLGKISFSSLALLVMVLLFYKRCVQLRGHLLPEGTWSNCSIWDSQFTGCVLLSN